MGIHRKVASVCIACSLLGFPLAGWAITLGEAYRAALENDPYFRSAYYASQAGNEEANIGRSQLLPEITFVARGSDNRGRLQTTNRLDTFNDSVNYTSSSAGVYLRQPLLSLERYAMFRQGSQQTEMSEKLFQSSRHELTIRIVSVYLDAALAQAGLNFAEAHLHAAEAQYKQAERMLSGGEATVTDVDAARTRLKLAEIQRMEFADRYSDAKQALEELTQLPADQIASFRRQPALKREIDLSLEQAVELAASQNLSVQEKNLAVGIAEQGVNRARSGHLPSLDLTASYTRSNQDNLVTLGQKHTIGSIGVEMQWPLLNGGETSASTRKAQAQLLQAQQEARIAIAKAKIEARTQYHAAKSSLTRIHVLDAAIEAGERNLKAVKMGSRLGVRTSVEVALAEKELAQSVYDHADAISSHIAAMLRLDTAMGTLEESRVSWAEQFTSGAPPSQVPK